MALKALSMVSLTTARADMSYRMTFWGFYVTRIEEVIFEIFPSSSECRQIDSRQKLKMEALTGGSSISFVGWLLTSIVSLILMTSNVRCDRFCILSQFITGNVPPQIKGK